MDVLFDPIYIGDPADDFFWLLQIIIPLISIRLSDGRESPIVPHVVSHLAVILERRIILFRRPSGILQLINCHLDFTVNKADGGMELRNESFNPTA